MGWLRSNHGPPYKYIFNCPANNSYKQERGGSDLTRNLWHNQSLFDVQLSALDQKKTKRAEM